MVAPPSSEAGKGKLGCVIVVAILALGVYVGKDVGTVYWRYYQMQDEVKSEAAFAPSLTDKTILERLVAQADTLGLPLGADAWQIVRTTRAPKQISITAAYDDSVAFQVLHWRKVFYFHFHPHARADL
ncbi:MAG TPA: hypothetical protein VMT77_04545 [Gemmatimonadales bacterium]|nr:hypothetical protein [Gemmatimonadales bacterium]